MIIDLKKSDLKIDQYFKEKDFQNAVYQIFKSNSVCSMEDFDKDVDGLFKRKPKSGLSPVKEMINGNNDELQ